jgi:hypothetical protein
MAKGEQHVARCARQKKRCWLTRGEAEQLHVNWPVVCDRELTIKNEEGKKFRTKKKRIVGALATRRTTPQQVMYHTNGDVFSM